MASTGQPFPRDDGAPTRGESGYAMRDVVRLSGLSRGIVLRLVNARIVAPARMGARDYLFDFRDLIVLRAARSLYASNVSSRRILAALRRLRSSLPPCVPLSGLRICVVGSDVVVHDGGVRWQAQTGQLLLDFDAVPDVDVDARIVEHAVEPASNAAHHFESACRLEDDAPDEACEHYRRAIACDETAVHAYINLGCLLHARGLWADAEAVYRDGMARCEDRAVLLFNLAVLQEDRGAVTDAIASYRAALEVDPALADAHFNLARVYAALGRAREAVRAYNDFRRCIADPETPE